MRDAIKGVTSDLVGRSRENRRRIAELVTSELRRQISRLGLATKDDIDRLGRRIRALEVSTKRATPAKKKADSAARKKKPASRRR